jgi:hypothetical protein
MAMAFWPEASGLRLRGPAKRRGSGERGAGTQRLAAWARGARSRHGCDQPVTIRDGGADGVTDSVAGRKALSARGDNLLDWHYEANRLAAEFEKLRTARSLRRR